MFQLYMYVFKKKKKTTKPANKCKNILGIMCIYYEIFSANIEQIFMNKFYYIFLHIRLFSFCDLFVFR